MKAFKISMICGFNIAFLSTLLSLIFNFDYWLNLVVVSFIGMFLGLLAAPEFEPKAFKYPSLFQSCCGIAVGVFFGIIIKGNAETLLASAFIGGMLGWSVSFWIKHALYLKILMTSIDEKPS